MIRRFSVLSCVVFLCTIAACGSTSPASKSDAGKTTDGASGSGDATAGSGGDAGAGGTTTGASGDTGTAGASATGSGGVTGNAGAAGGATGTAGGSGTGGASGSSGTAGKGGASGTDAGTDAAPVICSSQSACSVEGDTCETTCVRGAVTSCVCATPPGATSLEFLCASVQCSAKDAGAPDAGPSPPAVCPADIMSRKTACDPKTDTVCDTACVNMMDHRCFCNGNGTTGTWECANNQRTCP